MCWFIYDLIEPKCEVTNSIFAPSAFVLSFMYQFLDFIFKPPSTTTKSELDSARVARVTSKLSVNYHHLFDLEIDKEKQIYIF